VTSITFNIATLPFAERLHWENRKDWLSGRVTHSSLVVVAGLWGFSILWCAAIGFIASVNRAKIAVAVAESWTGAIVPAVVAGLGLVVILCAIGATLSWLRNGKSALVIETLPAFTGETFHGAIEAGKIIDGRRDYEVTLSCERLVNVRIRQHGSRHRTHSHFRRELVGKVTKTLAVNPSPARDGLFTIPVSIAVPDHYPGSLHEDDGTGIRWTLHVRSADGKSPAFGAAFEVPVYRREDLVER
jgi:hypothetical protein